MQMLILSTVLGDQADKPLNSSLITVTILRKPESNIRILICQ